MKGACPDKTVQVWFQDEARFGQQGSTTRKRARKGSRPWTIKHAKYKWLYLHDAVCPETGNSAAMTSPWVNMDATNVHLKWISDSVGPEDHSVLVLDRAGWHVSKELAVPPNITLRYLPPFSPELNPVENKWSRTRSHFLSNRALADHDHLDAAATDAFNAITAERNRSDCRVPWLTHVG